jgi:3-deoxy-7-phosphoheptulonate synthase
MIILMKAGATAEDINNIIRYIHDCRNDIIQKDGMGQCLLLTHGDELYIDKEKLALMNGVERIAPSQLPYRLASRSYHPSNTVVAAGDVLIGGDKLTVIAGPCSVESAEQMYDIASNIKNSGADILRGGAFKPRTSPYAFQGMGMEGISLLKEAGESAGMPVISEILSPYHLDKFIENVDIIQIGARNMHNYELLKEVGKTQKPILLKRGSCATIEEWLMAAEYIMLEGNENVILCERGIRTFETYTRSTLDLSAVCAVKQLSHLPVLVDPSHASGLSYMVPSLALAAVAAGADGIIIEVHNDPCSALCDGSQALNCNQFRNLMVKLRKIAEIADKEV